MKKYYSPKTECTAIIKGNIICVSNNDGTGQTTNPSVDTGSNSDDLFGAPRRRVF